MYYSAPNTRKDSGLIYGLSIFTVAVICNAYKVTNTVNNIMSYVGIEDGQAIFIDLLDVFF